METAKTQGVMDHEAKMEQIASDERKAAMQQTTSAEAKHAIAVADSLAAQGKITQEERNRIAKNQMGNMRCSQYPPPKPAPPTPAPAPKDPLTARHLQIVFHNSHIAPFPANYQLQLLRNLRILEGSDLPAKHYQDGVTEVGYKPVDARPSVTLNLSGEIRDSPNAGLAIKAETTVIKFSLDLWEKYDSTTIVVRPWTDKKTVRASSSTEAVSQLSVTLGGEGVVKEVAKIIGSGTYTWTPGERNKTIGHEEEMTVYLYRNYGGLEVVEVS